MKRKRYKDFDKIYQPDSCEPLIEAANSGQINMTALRRSNYPGIDLPDSVLPGVFSIGYWDAKINQKWGLDWHRNEGIEFSFLASGNLTFSTEKGQFNLNSGDLAITRPWQPHKLGDPNINIGKLYWMIIDVGVTQPHQKWKWPDWVILAKDDLEYLTKVLRQNEMPVWKTDKKLHDCFNAIGRCLDKSEKEIPHSKFNILINEFLLEMLNLFKKGRVDLDETLTVNIRTVEIFLNHLRRDFERHWTLEDMAEHCGLGITSLAKYCKQLTNMTPVNFLINTRLDAAAKMLSDPEVENVSRICYDCGFSSSQYFATAFKKQYKCSPSEYKLKFENS